MQTLNQAIEDAAAFKAFEKLLTKPPLAEEPSPVALGRMSGENRAQHRARLRRESRMKQSGIKA